MGGVAMKRSLQFVLGVAGVVAAAAFHTGGAGASAPAPLAVVVGSNSRLTNMSLYELKHLYMGDYINGPDGKRLIPLNRTPPDRVVFDATVLGMTADQAAAYWIDRRIRGQSGSPRAVPSADLAQRLVVHLEGAVAYVRADEVGAGVRVVRVDGKLPTDAGYPVR
jgi:hypothetical protein